MSRLKEVLEFKKIRKELEILSLVAVMAFGTAGCSKTRDNKNTSQTTTTIQTTQEPTVEVIKEGNAEIKNDTIDNIISEYESKTNKKLDSSNLFVDNFPQIKYLWKDNEGNYIYDYRINFNNNKEFKYCDTNNSSKMYALIVINEDGNFEPIAGLVDNGDGVKNVKITYCYKSKPYEPSQNYIYLNNPTKEDLDNLKDGNEFIKSYYTSTLDKGLTLSKENN